MKKLILTMLMIFLISCRFTNDADIAIDGSSTVGPITNAVVEEFALENKGIDIAVGVSGTGGRFKKFVAGLIKSLHEKKLKFHPKKKFVHFNKDCSLDKIKNRTCRNL